MTWSLNAAGHTPAPEGADGWADVEQRLHDELAAVLAKPEYGCTSSNFHSNSVTSYTLHVQPVKVGADPAGAHADGIEAAPDTGAAELAP